MFQRFWIGDAIIAVEPFENWNPMRDQEHLCNAVTDEVVHRLTRDHRFVVHKADSLASHRKRPRRAARSTGQLRR